MRLPALDLEDLEPQRCEKVEIPLAAAPEAKIGPRCDRLDPDRPKVGLGELHRFQPLQLRGEMGDQGRSHASRREKL